MKINEKQLARFASQEDSICADLKGWLWNKNKADSNYQKQWCVLKGNLFFYFDKEFDKEPNGLIVLENCFVQLVDGDEFQSTFSINFFGGKSKVYTFAAEDDEKCTDWVKALSTSSYRYMGLLVEALEKDVQILKQAKASKKHEFYIGHSFDDLDTLQENLVDAEDSTFTPLSTKCSSLSNILDASDNFEEELDGNFLSVKQAGHQGRSSKISRARSSSEIRDPAKYAPVVHSFSATKLKGKKSKLKHSMMKKISPKVSKRYVSKRYALKKHESCTSVPSGNEVIIESPPDIVYEPLADDKLVFKKMHDIFREEIARFIS